MNDERIEQLLRKGPAIKTPEALPGRLKQDIRMPRMEMGRADWTTEPSWFKRWMPALSFTAILLGCLVAIGVQTNMLADLRHQNAELSAAGGNLDALRGQNAEFQRLNRQSQELELLRKDNAEMQNLRNEATKLQAQLQEAAKLRADNQTLKASAANLASSGAVADSDFFAQAKAKAERIACVNNLKQIGLAARIWEGDNRGFGPTNFLCMSNELNNPVILQCPSDKSQFRRMTNWADLAAGTPSYQLLAPGIKETEDPRTVLFICPIHHNICLLDGSVQSLSEEDMKNYLKEANGRTIFVR